MSLDNYQKVKAWRAKNPDKVAEQGKRYRKKHPETAKKASAKYYQNNISFLRIENAEKARTRRLTPEYKEASHQRSEKFRFKKKQEQELIAGRPKPQFCEICGEDKYRIVFDHCHVKGHFRGWLCDRCNRTLGTVNDSIELLEKMIKYLKEK